MVSPAEKNRKQLDFPELTSLRFFAALIVVFFHNFGLLGGRCVPWIEAILKNGFTAVSFFFILSGYLLGRIYGEDFQRTFTFPHLWDYSVRRFARVYPVFVVGLILDAPRVISYFLHTTNTLTSAVAKIGIAGTANVLLVQSWFPRLAPAWNTPGWSLSNEAFFYLALPLLAAGIWTWQKQHLLWAMTGVLVGTWGLMALLLEILGPAASLPYWQSFLGYFPLLNLPVFIFGILLARLQAFSVSESSGLARWVEEWGFLVSAAAAFVLFENDLTIPAVFLGHGVVAPLTALCLYSLASGRSRGSAFLRWRWLVVLGQASYAIYIIHDPLVFLSLHLFALLGFHPAGSLSFWCYLLLVLMLSLAIFHGIEEPLRRKIVRRSSSAAQSRPK